MTKFIPLKTFDSSGRQVDTYIYVNPASVATIQSAPGYPDTVYVVLRDGSKFRIMAESVEQVAKILQGEGQ